MDFRELMAVVLVGAIGVCPLTAGEKERQPAEKEIERLADRCRKMLTLQTAVLDGTKSVNKAIQGRADKKALPADKPTLLKLAEKQKAVMGEAATAAARLRAAGTEAAAFAEVFEVLRADMQPIVTNLERGDVGPATQAIQTDVVDTLNEMIRALRSR